MREYGAILLIATVVAIVATSTKAGGALLAVIVLGMLALSPGSPFNVKGQS
jgi:hypothetical protein